MYNFQNTRVLKEFQTCQEFRKSQASNQVAAKACINSELNKLSIGNFKEDLESMPQSAPPILADQPPLFK